MHNESGRFTLATHWAITTANEREQMPLRQLNEALKDDFIAFNEIDILKVFKSIELNAMMS